MDHSEESKSEEMWNALSKEDQLHYFSAVCRRIHQGDMIDKGTFRWVLYNVFGFGTESYGVGMECGYLAIHNAICLTEELEEWLTMFAEECKIENVKERVTKFLDEKIGRMF